MPKPKAAKPDPKSRRYPSGLSGALAAMREHFGERPMFTLSTRRYIPMRHRALAELLSGEHRGLPTGCYIEVLGQPHSGKTTLAFACADAVVNQPFEGVTHRVITDEGVREVAPPRKVLYLDFEHTLDNDYLLGSVRNAVLAQTDERGKLLNPAEANIWVHQPETLEEGGDVLLYMIASGAFGLVVIDSVPAMQPEVERAQSMSKNTVGELARAMGKLFRRVTALMARQGVTLVLVNQWRDKIGSFYGDPRSSPGGRAAAYYDSIKLDVSGPHATPWFAQGKIANIKTMKNKVKGAIGEVATYSLGRGVGLSAEAELTECAMAAGLVECKGRWSAPLRLLPRGKTEQKKFRNAAEFFAALRAHPTLFDRLSRMAEARGAAPALASSHNGFEARR